MHSRQLLTSSGWRPGTLLNTLQCTGTPLNREPFSPNINYPCHGQVTFQQDCSLGKGKTTTCKETFHFCSELAWVQKLWLFFLKVYPRQFLGGFMFFKFKIPSTVFMFNSQPLSVLLQNSQRVFYFLYLDVCRGRLIRLQKKFIFSSLTAKVVHRRNKSQEPAISSRVSFASCCRKNPGCSWFNLCIFQQGHHVVNKIKIII